MYRYIFIIITTFFVSPAYAEPPEGYPFMSFDEASKLAVEKKKLLFVYFGRYGCGYCDKTNKEAFSQAEVKERYTKNYILAYVDSESGRRIRLPSGERITERELGTRYKANVTPVFSFMAPNGNVVLQLIGFKSKEDLLKADRKIQAELKKIGAI